MSKKEVKKEMKRSSLWYGFFLMASVLILIDLWTTLFSPKVRFIMLMVIILIGFTAIIDGLSQVIRELKKLKG